MEGEAGSLSVTDSVSLDCPGGADRLVGHSSAGESHWRGGEGVIVPGEGGDGRLGRLAGSLHHHWAAASLPHHGEGRHTEGVGLPGHQSPHCLLQAGAEDLQQQHCPEGLVGGCWSTHLYFVRDALSRHHCREMDGVSGYFSGRMDRG